jgi:hypothetical protein
MLQRTDGISISSLPSCLCSWAFRLSQFSNTIAVKKITCNGPNPTAGALQNYHTAEPTRTKQERPEFGMAVFHKRVNQNIRLESSRILNCSLSANYSFPWAIGPVLAEPNPLKEA